MFNQLFWGSDANELVMKTDAALKRTISTGDFVRLQQAANSDDSHQSHKSLENDFQYSFLVKLFRLV
jgi:hypothetical protein